MKFGEYLKRLRESRGMSVRQLALYAEVSNSYISQIENSVRSVPSPEVLRKLAKALRASYMDLMKAAGYLDEKGGDIQGGI